MEHMEVVSFLFCYMNANTDLICTASHRPGRNIVPVVRVGPAGKVGKGACSDKGQCLT